MPELPEVETIVRSLGARLLGRRILAFRSWWPRQVIPSVTAVRRAIVGRRVRGLRRRGKYLVFQLGEPGSGGDQGATAWLLIHLRMSGRLEWAGDDPLRPAHLRAAWTLDDGNTLCLYDARKFGRIIYTDDLRQVTARLGIEPLAPSFSTTLLAGLLAGRSRQLKPLLLDQSLIAGLGNIYTDEALFRARLHPLRRCDGLTRWEVRRLHRAIRQVLRDGIQHNGTSIDWVYPNGRMQSHLRVYGRDGRPCPRCGETIVSARIGQRGSHFCPACQPAAPAPRTRAIPGT